MKMEYEMTKEEIKEVFNKKRIPSKKKIYKILYAM